MTVNRTRTVVVSSVGRLRRLVGRLPVGWPEREMRLTRRGQVLAGLVVGLVALGWVYSPGRLNAVVAPALVALVVGAVSVRRAECRVVDVDDPPPTVPGEDRALVVETEGRGLATLVVDPADGVGIDGNPARTVSLPETVTWELSPTDRGIYQLDHLAVRVHGPLGLVESRDEQDLGVELAVYPPRQEFERPAVAGGSLHPRDRGHDQEFDRVREYTPGDPLRRVDWNASARHGDLHVVEFDRQAGTETLVVGGIAARGTADEMARAVRTLAESGLDAGLDVGVVVPDGRVDPDSGPGHRDRIRRLLAQTGPNTRADGYTVEVADHEADVLVDAGDPSVRRRSRDPTVRTPEGSYSLWELRSGSEVQA